MGTGVRRFLTQPCLLRDVTHLKMAVSYITLSMYNQRRFIAFKKDVGTFGKILYFKRKSKSVIERNKLEVVMPLKLLKLAEKWQENIFAVSN
jgi:hypothetical protein